MTSRTITAYTATALVGFALIFGSLSSLEAIYAAEDRDHQERFASIRGIEQ
ncbi:hypothetical protein [Aurantimonas sp. NFXS3]|uniref:hypothetical protein n=1 Tax=Aurantimonas sp. NFXS3 TaxID=2818434 RepID=UPI003B8DFBE1